MSERKIVIIGAGIAGLAAGCYARMDEYRTQIVEMHDKPGGLCTVWKRQGYTIDGCIHSLTGSGDSLFQVCEELGAVQRHRMLDHGVFVRVIGRDESASPWTRPFHAPPRPVVCRHAESTVIAT
jgi:phytoene dehydrogenase-like protein